MGKDLQKQWEIMNLSIFCCIFMKVTIQHANFWGVMGLTWLNYHLEMV
jgi:hypothetical protein